MKRSIYIGLIISLYALFLVLKSDFLIHFISIVCFLNLLFNFSQKIVLLEIISLYSTIIYLSGPAMGYNYFGPGFELTKIMDNELAVNKQTYFNYAMPAISIFLISLQVFRMKNEEDFTIHIIQRIRKLDFKQVPFIFITVGFIAENIKHYLPQSLQYIFTILFFLLFVGLSMLIYKRVKTNQDWTIIILALLWIMYVAIKSSMFTLVVYMGVTFLAIFFSGKHIKHVKKFIYIILLGAFLITLQHTKNNYRLLVRRSVESQITVSRFVNIYLQNMRRFEDNFRIENLFYLYLRFSNGYNLSLVMNRFPKKQNFDGGDALFKSIASSFVPRLVWPGKPMAGGKFNMKYYAGVIIDKFTTNIGPIGEAYGAFGKNGGILFMGLFGLSISLFYNKYLLLCGTYPILLVYMPILFFELNYCMENDTLQAINSVVKISIFLFLFFKIFPTLLTNGVSRPSIKV